MRVRQRAVVEVKRRLKADVLLRGVGSLDVRLGAGNGDPQV